MSDENIKISIADGRWTWNEATVVVSADDPTINAIVVCNADWSNI